MCLRGLLTGGFLCRVKGEVLTVFLAYAQMPAKTVTSSSLLGLFSSIRAAFSSLPPGGRCYTVHTGAVCVCVHTPGQWGCVCVCLCTNWGSGVCVCVCEHTGAVV